MPHIQIVPGPYRHLTYYRAVLRNGWSRCDHCHTTPEDAVECLKTYVLKAGIRLNENEEELA